MIFRYPVGPNEPSTQTSMELIEEGVDPPIVTLTPKKEFTSITAAMRESGLTNASADIDSGSPEGHLKGDEEDLSEENSKEESLQGPTRRENEEKKTRQQKVTNEDSDSDDSLV